MKRQDRAKEVARRLALAYPNAYCELEFQNPFQLLIATVLSAQCTDKRVNMVTKELFRQYPDATSLAQILQSDLESLIHSTGFFRNKAKNIRLLSRTLLDQYEGQVPQTMDALSALPGVGRKTANVVLGNAFGINQGFVVDTHIGRVTYRLGLTAQTHPVKVEQDLMKLYPQSDWTRLSHEFISHGRKRCFARKPDCLHCELADICPSYKKFTTISKAPQSPKGILNRQR